MSSFRSPVVRHIVTAVSLPWGAFVAGFLYYTVLTLAAIGAAEVPASVVAVSYLLPVAAYAALIAARSVRWLAALPVDLVRTPQAVAR